MSFDINISKIKCSGRHGIYDQEKQNDQQFLVDININISEKIVFKYAKSEAIIQEIMVTVHKPDTILKDRTEGISVSYCEKFK